MQVDFRCVQKSKKIRKIAKNRPKKERTQKIDGLRVPLSRRAPPSHRRAHGRSVRLSFSTCGVGTPAHCDAERISAGGPIRESAAAGPNLAKNIQKLPTIYPKAPKSSQIPPQTLPKSTPNASKRPLGAYLGARLSKSSILNAQKRAKRHPRAPKRRPTASQPFPNGTQDRPKSIL